ncbi:hypothetical protein [Haloarcula onubensis]|uniref:Uncharacterized protein n=1 Tax=Haloarcula onubensis TaxID=2950539 RepID=A0ABU2FK33_9EURY|nr:hypothetical protein [Halomicroarcula sp. S3CR25-11]MDS0281113.1 hypothetical protein [Halomicroarcula sp. S3CR25-11]
MSDTPPMKVDCTECPYSRIVAADSDRLPADLVVEHGQETGHKLTIETLEESSDRAASSS